MNDKAANLGALGAIYAGLAENDVFKRTRIPFRDQMLMRVSAVLGAGHTGILYREAVEAALQGGLDAVTAEDLVIHLASYIGLARAFDAMAVLRMALQARNDPHDIAASRSGAATLPMAERFERGIALYSQLDGPRAHAQLAHYSAVSPEYYQYVMGMFGCTFGRDSLDVREREIATVAVLGAMGTAGGQLAFHARIALEQGAQRDTLAELLLYVQLYAGLPAANNAAAVVRDALAAREAPAS
ncbi:carboxymuconolactone decarboxylase family protein [Bordetella petrii]|uniref:carboxymuconolactone decarboxylase family protein n=1 Tax=Bordetella petrii TaxID=94624 RepID=UPI001E36124B|nr:carboxymuconolactone decarboxylase family protein [Bordetella petrii]MCD0503663.1 carboxymuconolactone decarboxylase family protein [Bordetella petrii]